MPGKASPSKRWLASEKVPRCCVRLVTQSALRSCSRPTPSPALRPGMSRKAKRRLTKRYVLETQPKSDLNPSLAWRSQRLKGNFARLNLFIGLKHCLSRSPVASPSP